MNWPAISESTAHHIGAIPLAWLVLLAWRGKQREGQWWSLGIAFFISWLADSAVDAGMNAWVVSVAFPVSQTALIGAVFLNRSAALILTVVLVATGCLAVAVQGVGGPDIILSSVASVAVGVCVWKSVQRKVRASLVVYFGLGQVAWVAHALAVDARAEGWYLPTYFAYQGCRLAGLLLFCWACWDVRPSFRIVE